MSDVRDLDAKRNAVAVGSQYNGRTDGRTNEESHQVASKLTAADVGARMDDSTEAVDIGDVLAEWIETYGQPLERFDVVRVGDRERIPGLVRWSIAQRDHYQCRVCKLDMSDWLEYIELDHVIPWSAGGPDDSDNLRVLCRPHNQQRSNFDDGTRPGRLLPTTYWCNECWPDLEHEMPRPWQPRREWKNHVNLSLAPQQFEGDDSRQVYCAYCQMISRSRLYFVGQMGRDLAAQAEQYVPGVES